MDFRNQESTLPHSTFSHCQNEIYICNEFSMLDFSASPNPSLCVRSVRGIAILHKRQIAVPPPPPPQGNTTSTTASATSSANSALPTNSNTTAIAPTNTTSLASTSSAPAKTSTSLSGTSTIPTTSSNPTSTTEPSSDGSNKTLVIGGAAVGGLVFVIGIAIIAFRCTLNRRDRQRRNKEMAATLAESFDRDPVSSPRKGYLELGDGSPTPNSGRGGSNLSRQGSQDAYFGAHKEGGTMGQPDYYNPHYVQERYGTANAGNYAMYEETELSVIGGSSGRPTTPYNQHGDHSMAYPPTSKTTNHYQGYNEYGSHNDRGYYGGGGQGY
ncbi:hypothetical protein BGX27_010970 [Mortierella sp. AM989]|nr:hypothetical protein BGX27_010970 [Mortierella sp. AM989]